MAIVKNTGAVPESLSGAGDSASLEMDLSIITYDTNFAQIKHLLDIDELLPYKDQNDSKTVWINLSGLKDIDPIKKLGLLFDIHPLSVEDIHKTEHQPKVEIFEKYWFLSIKTIQREKNFHHGQEKKSAIFINRNKKESSNGIEEFMIDQVSMIIMKNAVITIQEIPGDSFDRVRKRILDDIGEIRRMGTDYLAYAIIDAVVDEYFLTLNHLEEDIENFEDRAVKKSDDRFIEELQDTKKYLLQIKRAVSPLKDNMLLISRQEKFFKTDELKPFLQDLNENLNHAIVTIENYREWLSNIMDVYLSVLSHQTNKVMKVLAIISTIFIPLTFIAGVYGMNFDFMPELRYKLGYPIVLGIMGFIALTMIILFKIRRWF